MEEEIKIELERAKLTNYVLKKENEILLGTIGALSNEKKELISQLDRFKNSKTYKIKRKIKDLIKTIIGRK